LEVKFFERFKSYETRYFDAGRCYKISPRVAYQLFGTEVMRDYDGVIWLKNVDISPENVTISDVRFENEAEFVYANGGEVIKVFNPRLTEEDGHKSEQGIPSHLYGPLIVNDGTLEDLYKKVDNLMETLYANGY